MHASAAEIQEPEEVLRQARAGDTQALSILLDIYRNYLSLLARINVDRRLQAKVDASDLVQEAILHAYRGFGDFRGTSEAELLQWLRKILATRTATAVRRFVGAQCRDVRLENRLELELDQSSIALDHGLVSPDSSPSHRASRRETAVMLADAMSHLPDDYREVLVLHHFQGLAIAQVATRMGRSMDSVKALRARALIRLHSQLDRLT